METANRLNLKAIAAGHFSGFVEVISKLARSPAKFDLVAAPANSGTILSYLFGEIYRQFNRIAPQALVLPIFTPYRFSEIAAGAELPFDHGALVDQAAAQLSRIKNLRTVIFLDDEVGHGTAFRSTMEVLLAAARQARKHGPRSCLIVAETNGLGWLYTFPPLEVQFEAFALRPDYSVSGTFFEIVPDELIRSIQAIFPELDRKAAIATALGLPIKQLSGRRPELTDTYLRRIREMQPDYEKNREALTNFFQTKIQSELTRLRK